MELLDAIWAAYQKFCAEDPRNERETALLLISHETLRDLYRSKVFAEENTMRRPDLPQTIFGIRIVESGDVTGWKLVKIESESE